MHNFNLKNKYKKINNEKKLKPLNKQPLTLAYMLVFQTMNFLFSFIFWSKSIEFPCKRRHVDANSN